MFFTPVERATALIDSSTIQPVGTGGRGDHRQRWPAPLPDPGTTPEHAVEAALDVAESHRRLVRSRLDMLRGYAETTGCRRQYLLGYFGEELAGPCGNCDTCGAGTAEAQAPGTDEFPRDSSVRHAEWGHGVVISVEPDRMTVLFDDVGYKTLSLDAVRENDLLTAVDEGG